MRSIAYAIRPSIRIATISLFMLCSLATGSAPELASDFGGPERTLTHVSTDKPIYRTGERVYVRGVVLRANGHTPVPAAVPSYVEIKGPKGEIVSSGVAVTTDSTVGFSWDVPTSQAGGEYTVRVSNPFTGDAPAERRFDIRAYRAPRLKSQITFVRDGYGPGDTVVASLHVERAEGGIPAGAKVAVAARVDGRNVWNADTTVDTAGNADTRFALPKSIERGEGTLAMTIGDGGAVETASKTIPILLQTVDMGIYPEGGDLIAGLSNRIYFESRTLARKPADIAGVVVNAAGDAVASFRTEHEGRGRFTFVPARGERYSLRITEPSGIRAAFPLPAVHDSGVVISAASNVISPRRNATVRVAATAGGTYHVMLSQRGKELTSKQVFLKPGVPESVALGLPAALNTVDGVLVATVYDADRSLPVAERLLFRQPQRSLKVQVAPDKSQFTPGDSVTLRVTTTDHLGKPVGAVVGLTVTDSSVLEMIDKREQAPRLPVMVLLESDVKDLADAHVYLDETNAKAPLATDLLLGTQGWRRFATVDSAKFISSNGDAARRALAARMLTDADRSRAASLWYQVQQLTAMTSDPWTGGPGSIRGWVRDKSLGAMPGVTVVLVNTATNATQAIQSSEIGGFFFPSIQPGTYRLMGTLRGFKTAIVPAIRVANTAQQFDLTMEVGELTDTIVVRGDPAEALRSTSATIGDVLPEYRIRELPLVTNDILDLVRLLPGYRAATAGDELDRIGGLDLNFVNTTVNGLTVSNGRWANLANSERGARGIAAVREYAHALLPSRSEDSRRDFSETLYWNAGVKTDPATGVASVSFKLSDTVTAFSVLADGFTTSGALGSGGGTIESVRPFFIEPKLPLQVTGGDLIQLPVGLVNNTNGILDKVGLTPSIPHGITLVNGPDTLAPLGARERVRRILTLSVDSKFSGSADFKVAGNAGAFRDVVERKLDVQPLGYPYERSNGGVIQPNESGSFEFTLPAETVNGSVSANAVLFPTPLANMTEALRALVRQPYGCFEQTSSTSYPMVMAQQYFLTHSGVDASIIDQAKTHLETSYKRLTGFESPTRGYEWFGRNPGHEALTAYGLLQFTDMARVRGVDQEMIQRTRAWLVGRRDGAGGFLRDSRGHGEGFGSAPAQTTNAYITWALVESGEKGLEKEIAAVKALAENTSDSYIVALGANILHATGDKRGALRLMDKLAGSQDPKGFVKGGSTSITRSGGVAINIETTALSLLAWMREPVYRANVAEGIRWIAESNQGGRFGSTQSTVLSLRAIVAYDELAARPKRPGRVVLTMDGKTIGAPRAFTADMQGAIVLAEFGSELGPGKHTIALRMEDGSTMPFSIGVKYHSTLPDSSKDAKVGIDVALTSTQVREGGITEARVSVANKSDLGIPTPIAIVGIPGGLEVRHDQLKELVKARRIDAYEVRGREVVLYWREIGANEKVEFPLSLIAAVPGRYTGPASRAYLYYTDEQKSWAPGLAVTITPR